MLNYYGAARRLKKELKAALKDRDRWQQRADALTDKLEKRTDLFVEREFRLVDRFLTKKVGTFAITDEIQAKQITEQEVKDADLQDFLAEKRDFLVQCARDANVENPEQQAADDFAKNYDRYVLEFQAG